MRISITLIEHKSVTTYKQIKSLTKLVLFSFLFIYFLQYPGK